MLKIIVTATAETDMQEIFDFIAKDNVKYALKIIDEFEKKFELIATFPDSGFRKSYFVRRNIRECIVAKHYQIIYYVKNDILYIQRVLTGYEDYFQTV